MILGISITSASEIIPLICEICGSQKENKMETDLSDLSEVNRTNNYAVAIR